MTSLSLSLVLLVALALCLLSPVLSALVDQVDSIVYTSQPVSPPISPSYIGFSLEHDIATTWTGLSHTRPSFITLVQQLHPTRTPHTGTTFRIGGNSADYSLYTNGSPLPANLSTGFPFTYAITDADIMALRDGVAAVDGELIVGLNFRYPNASLYAIPHLQAIQRLIGWKEDSVLRGIEIGNEPDLSDKQRIHEQRQEEELADSITTGTHSSTAVAAYFCVRYGNNGNRGKKYAVEDYYDDFDSYMRQLHAAVPELPMHFVQGADYCCDTAWQSVLGDYVKRFTDELFRAGVHHYPYAACDPKTTPDLADLLIDAASTKLATSLVNSSHGNIIHTVNTLGYNLSLSEGNSVACSGAPGVSNTFGSNLWVTDELFNSAQAGLSSWIFHSHDLNTSHYPPLVWQQPLTSDVPTVQPEWYALLFFAFASADYATIVRTDTSSSNHFIKVWTTINELGVIKVAILHKALNASGDASVRVDLSQSLQSPYPTAELYRLTAPSAYSTYGLDFAGLSFDNTTDGRPSGTLKVEHVDANSAGVYIVSVSAISLSLLTINPTEEAYDSLPIDYVGRRASSDNNRHDRHEKK